MNPLAGHPAVRSSPTSASSARSTAAGPLAARIPEPSGFSAPSRGPERRVGGLVLEVKGDFCYRVREILRKRGRVDDNIELRLDSPYRYVTLHVHNPLDRIRDGAVDGGVRQLHDLFTQPPVGRAGCR